MASNKDECKGDKREMLRARTGYICRDFFEYLKGEGLFLLEDVQERPHKKAKISIDEKIAVMKERNREEREENLHDAAQTVVAMIISQAEAGGIAVADLLEMVVELI